MSRSRGAPLIPASGAPSTGAPDMAQVGAPIPNPIAGSLPRLAGAQFVALAWVALNQFRAHLDLHLGERSGLVTKGYLGAALYFVLFGVLASHLYWRAQAQHRLNYRALLGRFLVSIYPLHVAAMAAMVAMLALNRAFGEPLAKGQFPPLDALAQLLLLQAWGVVRQDSWNFPAWLVSALWFATLALPLVARFGLRWRTGLVSIAVAAALFVVLYIGSDALGLLFTDLTTKGALQTIPAMLLGAGLYRLAQTHSLPPAWGWAMAAAAAIWVAIGASLRLSDLLLWPAFGLLAFGLLQARTAGGGSRVAEIERYLGRIALPMFLFYLPVDIAYFHALDRLLGPAEGAAAWWRLTGVFPAILLTGVAAHHLIQAPAERALNRRRRHIAPQAQGS